MSVLQHGIASPGSSGGAAGNERSLRLRRANSAYLSRTFGTPTSNTTWTLSLWVKRGDFPGQACPFLGFSGTEFSMLAIDGSERIAMWNGASEVANSTALYRDCTGFAHIVFKSNGTNIVAYFNNATWFTYTGTVPAFNSAVQHQIGGSTANSRWLDCHLAEIYFVDGQALTPSSFGQLDANNIWVPKTYSGTYGNNGFHLDFRDASSTTTIGYDTSGNGNHWTSSGISVTAGVTYDSMYDYPVNGTSGTQPIGCYATLNSIYPSAANISKGNLASGTTAVRATISASAFTTSGAYWEVTAGASAPTCGVISDAGTTNTTTVTANKVFGFRLTNAGALDYINITDAGSWTGITTGLTGNQYPYGVTQAADWNFGQRPFIGTASGQALCTANLPTPAILDPSDHFGIKTRSGTGASNAITGLGFQPDLVWVKARSAATAHYLTDSVRGVTKSLNSNNTNAEATDANGITAFGADGYTVGSDTNYNNSTGPVTYVDWCWKAGGAPTTDNVAGAGNTPTAGSVKIDGANLGSALAGSIAATRLSANTTAGFSIVKYVGNGSDGATVAHGLGKTPALILVKSLDNGGGATNWIVPHQSLTISAESLFLNLTNAKSSAGSGWVDAWSSTTFTLNTGASDAINVNRSGDDYVAYCWAEIEGFSKFTSYASTATADNAFIYTGFRPKFILFKKSSTTGNWGMIDAARSTYNVALDVVNANLADAETTVSATTAFDFCASGVKVRGTHSAADTLVCGIFAEFPLALNPRAR